MHACMYGVKCAFVCVIVCVILCVIVSVIVHVSLYDYDSWFVLFCDIYAHVMFMIAHSVDF